MFSWYRAQVKDHGLLPATQLLSQVVRYRIPVVFSNRFLPPKLECPCCGWQGRRFLDYIEVGYRVPNTACPGCDSHARHRAFYLWLKNDFELATKVGRALLFAPERALAPLWEAAREVSVFRTDIERSRGVDLLADITRLPFIDESLDLIWCHHVLEQVSDDQAALRELYRVLKAAGEFLVSVGVTGRKTTTEFGRSNKALSGNRRLYGDDFSKRLAAAGFKFETIIYELNAEDSARYGIQPVTLYRCMRAH